MASKKDNHGRGHKAAQVEITQIGRGTTQECKSNLGEKL